MNRFILIGTRKGKRAVNWRGLLGAFAAYATVFTLSSDFAGWGWSAIVRETYRADWGHILWFGLVMSVVFLAIGIVRAWRLPLAYLTALDRPS